MCAFAPLLIASTAMSALGNIMQGQNAAAAGKMQNAAYQQQAEADRLASGYEATREFERGERAVSSGVAKTGASGVVGGASVTAGLEDIVRQNQLDIEAIRFGSTIRQGQLRTKGEIAERQGEMAQTAGYIGAAGSVMNGLTTYYNPAKSVKVGGSAFA